MSSWSEEALARQVATSGAVSVLIVWISAWGQEIHGQTLGKIAKEKGEER